MALSFIKRKCETISISIVMAFYIGFVKPMSGTIQASNLLAKAYIL